MTDSEVDELLLRVEEGICKLPLTEMEQLVEHEGFEFKGKTKLAVSRTIRAKVEEELGESESKVEYLEGILNLMSETPPPLEGNGCSADKSEEVAKVKTEYEALSKQFRETLESYKKMEEASIKLEGIESSKMAAAF